MAAKNLNFRTVCCHNLRLLAVSASRRLAAPQRAALMARRAAAKSGGGERNKRVKECKERIRTRDDRRILEEI